MKTKEEIEMASERSLDMQNAAMEKGSKYRGMTYEDGIQVALSWVLGYEEEDPTLDE